MAIQVEASGINIYSLIQQEIKHLGWHHEAFNKAIQDGDFRSARYSGNQIKITIDCLEEMLNTIYVYENKNEEV